MLKVAIIGFGAIGQELARQLQAEPEVSVTQIIVPHQAVEAARAASARLAPDAVVLSSMDISAGRRPGLVAECASQEAVMAHVLPALEAGIPCIVASVGALHESNSLSLLEAAGRKGNARLQLISGAIGALDALSAARVGGLENVTYIGRKPPHSWRGTPAEKWCKLDDLTAPQVIFRGTARDAASMYPKNANVAATVAFAGIGLDETQVELIADPGIERNVHTLVATGAFGELMMRIENRPLPDNPKTSALAAYSLTKAVRSEAAHVVL